jgi:hypothetical protein
MSHLGERWDIGGTPDGSVAPVTFGPRDHVSACQHDIVSKDPPAWIASLRPTVKPSPRSRRAG